ncbi:glycine-rich domain-containing protein [Halomonas sp. 328]|uniref:glycine-rich domain-containing protein n=1 Tax=Halomonas sp. 328 TaxID=2776704 RepID=UPI001E65985C|nr:glycine-rich domain-containing protein-like [Halomonas sp. 328]
MSKPEIENEPTLEEAVKHIDDMDFSLIKGKLKKEDPSVSRVWGEDELDVAVQYYKNFLYLNKKYIDEVPVIVPSIEVDEIWHHHILDTRSYIKDCASIFGYYFHHYPYFGMRSEVDYKNLGEAYEVTQMLHELEFGERMKRIWA